MQTFSRILLKGDVSLVTNPIIAKQFGRSAALLLQQVHFWISSPKKYGTTENGKRWIYNSYEEWQKQISIISVSTIRRCFKTLEESNVILTKKFHEKKGDQTKSYTINYDFLEDIIRKNASNMESCRDFKVSEMNTSTVQNEQFLYRYTETTSETNTHADDFSQNVEKKESATSGVKDQELVQKMIDVWNELVEEGREVIQLTSRRAAFLKKALSDKFHNSLDEWKSYCRSVASSSFLMGKIKSTFKATLDWALKFETIQRILEGAYGVKPVEIASNQEEGSLIHDIQDSEEEGVVKLIRSELLDNFGAATYRSWFKDLKILHQDSVISVVTDTAFRRDCIRNRFESDLQKIISSFSGSQSSLRLVLA